MGATPFVTSVATAIFIGWILVVGSVVQIVDAFSVRHRGRIVAIGEHCPRTVDRLAGADTFALGDPLHEPLETPAAPLDELVRLREELAALRAPACRQAAASTTCAVGSPASGLRQRTTSSSSSTPRRIVAPSWMSPAISARPMRVSTSRCT
jgi:short repeat uncharacterized protein DUF308